MERLLLVDDDTELCEILTEYFSAEGFAVESAHDGVRGLERARSGEHALVILDLLLPGLRGLDVLRQLRSDFTSRADPHRTGEDVDRVVGLELGADDYLPKPFNSRELMARGARSCDAPVQSRRTGSRSVTSPWTRRRDRRGGTVPSLTMAEFVMLEDFSAMPARCCRASTWPNTSGRTLLLRSQHRCARQQPAEEARRGRWRSPSIFAPFGGRVTCSSGSIRSASDMRSLLLKIFLWLWITLIGTAAAFATLVFSLRLGPEAPPTGWHLAWGAALMVSGLICYALTRYLTGPVLRLRAAARRLTPKAN